MFGKACKRIVVVFFPLMSLFFFSITLSAQENEDNLFFMNIGPTETQGEYRVAPIMEPLVTTGSIKRINKMRLFSG